MPTLAADTRRELGMRAAHSRMLQQNKVWAKEPDGLRWEWYRVIEDSETFGGAPTS